MTMIIIEIFNFITDQDFSCEKSKKVDSMGRKSSVIAEYYWSS